jgi:hypothetical protein
MGVRKPRFRGRGAGRVSITKPPLCQLSYGGVDLSIARSVCYATLCLNGIDRTSRMPPPIL